MWKEEADSPELRYLVAGFAITLLFFPGLTFVFGVSPIVTTTIVLCFLIVLITTGGCALHLREIERLEDATTLIETRESVDLHVKEMRDTIAEWKEKLAGIDSAIAQGAELERDAGAALATARRLVVAMEERFEKLVAGLLRGSEHDILNAADLADSPLEIPGSKDAEPLPALPSHLWRDTLSLLASDAEAQLRVKQDEAA